MLYRVYAGDGSGGSGKCSVGKKEDGRLEDGADCGQEQCMYPRCECTDEMLSLIDVLVDGEFQTARRDPKLLWKGSSNQRVIDVQATLEQKNPQIPVLYCGDYRTGDA